MHYFNPFMFACLLSFSVLQGQDVEIFTYWHPGDGQHLTIEEGFIEYEDNTVVKKEVTTSKVEISVLEETDSTYIIEWNYVGDEVDRINVEVEEDPMDEKIDQMFANTKLVFQTDEFGVFQKMLNMDELMDKAFRGLETLVKEEMEELDSEESQMFMGMMQEMLGTEEMKDELIKDIWNYHYYLGDIFVSDTTIQYTDEIENQIGDEHIPIDGLLTISTDRAGWTIDINDLKKFKTAALHSAISDGLSLLDAADSEEVVEELEKMEFDIRDIENYTYDFNYGWLNYYERKRVTTAQNMRKENFIIMYPSEQP